MEQENLYISADDLDTVKSLIIDKDIEACGFLLEEEKSSRLQLYIERYGEKIGSDRGVCQTTKYTKYIWHTHPHNVLEYPSPQDIYTILKWHPNNNENNFPNSNIMFSSWGIWEISFPHKKFILDDNWLQYLHNVTDIAFHGLWHITREKGLSKISRKHLESTIDSLQYIINQEPVFDNAFRMSFTSWSDIGKNSNYFLKFP